ncbi:unnamed protein product [Pleuronectes platessa]|uniref:Uncharacterized protein n=1 Tax=Pleuronectes platessa TaxID=8262 RepID=A0A9N7TL95_PLEPL|nr:unnamed protein product [Pleuronectes platessa]
MGGLAPPWGGGRRGKNDHHSLNVNPPRSLGTDLFQYYTSSVHQPSDPISAFNVILHHRTPTGTEDPSSAQRESEIGRFQRAHCIFTVLSICPPSSQRHQTGAVKRVGRLPSDSLLGGDPMDGEEFTAQTFCHDGAMIKVPSSLIPSVAATCNARNSSLEGQVIYLDMVLHVAEPRRPSLPAMGHISAASRARWHADPLQ